MVALVWTSVVCPVLGPLAGHLLRRKRQSYGIFQMDYQFGQQVQVILSIGWQVSMVCFK
jgi:hypothetical protein